MRTVSRDRDRGSMSLMMVVMIVGLGLGALMIPILVTQARTTTHTDSRVQSLHLAQSGINVMLGRLRYATQQGGGGVSGLPCADLAWPDAKPTTGYTVSVKYYLSESATGTELTCPFDIVAKPVVPRFARITSVGVVQTGTSQSTRTLDTTYAFKTTDTGQIRLNPRQFLDADETQCLSAAGAPPEAGMQVYVQACLGASAAATDLSAQQFFYGTDLTLVLAHSRTDALPDGLCISMSTQDSAITLQPCAKGTVNPLYNQQWRLYADDAFVAVGSGMALAVRPTGTDIVAKAHPEPAGPDLHLVADDPTASWLPTPSVGAGAAGPGTIAEPRDQLLNYSRFGSCLQAANYDQSTIDKLDPLVLYPCVQSAEPAGVPQYQKFTYDPTTSRWSSTDASGTANCLTTTGEGETVTLQACGAALSQKWTDHGSAVADQLNASQQWDDATRYTIVSDVVGKTGKPLCLSLTTDPHSPTPYSEITSDVCDQSSRQNWNAGSPSPTTVTNTGEH